MTPEKASVTSPTTFLAQRALATLRESMRHLPAEQQQEALRELIREAEVDLQASRESTAASQSHAST